MEMVPNCPVPDPGEIWGRVNTGLMYKRVKVVVRDMAYGLFALHMKDMLAGKLLTLSRNWPGLGGELSLRLTRLQVIKTYKYGKFLNMINMVEMFLFFILFHFQYC